jgi:hypothetical protein
VKKKLITGVALMALCVTTSANAQNNQGTVVWKKMDIWVVVVDRSLNDGCFLAFHGTRGTNVRIGFNKAEGDAYIWIAHKDWQSLEDGKKYPITIQFDSEPAWSGHGTGILLDQLPGVLLVYKDTRFFADFAERQVMSIWYGQKPITQLSLKGSFAAMQEMWTCQKYMDANRSAPPSAPPAQGADPFRGGSRGQPISDPFR